MKQHTFSLVLLLRRWQLLLLPLSLLATLALLACSSSSQPAKDARADGPREGGAQDAAKDVLPLKDAPQNGAKDGKSDLRHDLNLPRPDYLLQLPSAADYALLQAPINGKGAYVRFLLQVDGRKAPAPLDKECIFQNTEKYDYHIKFITSFPELKHIDFKTYVQMMNFQKDRVWWGGALSLRPNIEHPVTKVKGLITYEVYQQDAESENLTLEQFVEIDRRMKNCMPYAKDLLAVTPGSTLQLIHLDDLQDALRAKGVIVYISD
jgi:hypothetical protein